MKWILIALIYFISGTGSAQKINYESVTGSSGTIPTDAIVIMIGDLSCSACILDINTIFKGLKLSKIPVFVFIDSYLVQDFQRPLYAAQLSKKLRGFDYEIVFLPANSKTLLSASLKACDISKSPYLILNKGIYHYGICYEELFDSARSIKSTRRRIKKIYK